MEFKNESIKIAYKLLHDTLFLLLLAFAVLLISDGLLPGLISSYFSFTKLTLLVFANLAALIYLGKKNDFLFADFDIKHSKLVFLLVTAAFFLLGNSMLKFSYWENIIIIFSTLAIFYFFHKIIFTSQDK